MPAGYQFGDAGKHDWFMDPQPLDEIRAAMYGTPDWRPLHENAAAQLARAHVHDFSRYNPTVHADFCACGARRDRSLFLSQLKDHGHWNVIEGEDH